MSLVSSGFSITLFIAAGFSAVLAFIVWGRRETPSGTYLALLLFSFVFWGIADGMEAMVVSEPAKILWSKISYIGAYSAAPLFVMFSLAFSQYEKWLTRRIIILLWAIPVFMVGLVFTNEWHEWVWSGFTYQSVGNLLFYHRGPLFWVGVNYAYISMFVATILLIDAAIRFSLHYRFQSWLLILAAIIPWISNMLYIFRVGPFPGRNLTPIAFVVSGFLIVACIYRFHLLDLVPVARGKLLDSMNELVFVTDSQYRVMDLNLAAVNALGLDSAETVFGKPSVEILQRWVGLGELLQSASGQFTEHKEIQDSQGNWFDVQIVPLKNRQERTVGWLILLRDISEHKHLEKNLKDSEEIFRRLAIQAETLQKAAAAVASTLNQEEAIERILEQLEHVVPYDSASVQLLREGALEIVGGRGFEDMSIVLGLRLPLTGENASSVVFEERAPIVLEDAQEKFEAFRVPPHNHIHGWLGVPMIVQDRMIGMIALDSVKVGTFNREHADLAAAFADQVAVALENARLFNQVEVLARTDPLTAIYNRRHFYTLADKEFRRAGRYGHPLAVLMFDIDHFKRFNDTYGHHVGDDVLVEIAKLVQKNLRDVDVFGRYGGEEFIIMAPETNLKRAEEIAERLRVLIEQTEIGTRIGRLGITVSFGVSAMEGGPKLFMDDVEVLINQADQALYSAKEMGRNRVALFGVEK
ncbi:MAG: diguanylate cyclase [Anaerolineales bacterium]|nr:diguanylate cyclase [Anaerolineales bacterium]